MRDRIEVTGQVAVNHFGMSASDQPFDLPDGVEGAPAGTVTELLRLQIGLEDRLQDQHRRHLCHTIDNARNAPSTLPPPPNPLRDSWPSPIPITRSADRKSRSSRSAGGSIRISSSDSLTGTMPPSP